MADQEEDLSSLSLQDRFAHKGWKVRKDAYEAAAQVFNQAQSETDPTVRQFVQDASIWKGAVGDSNVAAQQEGLGALVAFLQISASQGCIRYDSMFICFCYEINVSVLQNEKHYDFTHRREGSSIFTPSSQAKSSRVYIVVHRTRQSRSDNR